MGFTLPDFPDCSDHPANRGHHPLAAASTATRNGWQLEAAGMRPCRRPVDGDVLPDEVSVSIAQHPVVCAYSRSPGWRNPGRILKEPGSAPPCGDRSGRADLFPARRPQSSGSVFRHRRVVERDEGQRARELVRRGRHVREVLGAGAAVDDQVDAGD